ncbi:MAG: DNA repair protein, partial [Pseudomonadota bacterium]
MTDTAQPKTVLETILEWSSTRPDWMRDALRRIVSGGTPSEGDLSELFNLCKKEHGDDTITLKAEPLDATHLPVDPGAGESVSIAAIKNVIGVNQLARDQKLAFETKGITIIYGPNGTGKSGYSRILKKACRARHAGEIMPDVYNPSPTGNATATLSVQKSDGSEQQIPWKDNRSSVGALSAITVFDRDSGSVHVQKKNT